MNRQIKNIYLEQILAEKQLEVNDLQDQRNNKFERLFIQPRQSIRIIAEIKRKSPSAGSLFEGDALSLVNEYELGGADAVSYVTDSKFFNGSDEEFVSIVYSSGLPVLKKDFVIDASQVVSAYSMKADAVLLIARIVSPKNLKSLILLCKQLGIVPVVEIFQTNEIETVIRSGANIIAVNTRDLATQNINITQGLEVLELLPASCVKLLFSGINTAEDIAAAKNSGANGVLVGTSLLKSNNRVQKLINLRGTST